MLSSLSIRDVVIIDRLDLEFPPGLCALTGETGAGKSILLDALGLALGSRADARLVRQGAAQATVTAAFRLPPAHPALTIIAAQGIDGIEDGLILRRTVSSDGRSRAFVNDQPASVSLLRRLGETLVEIHGQYDNQKLLDANTHRVILDAFGVLQTQVTACATAWNAWQVARDARLHAEEAIKAARRDEDFLRHAMAEIEKMHPEVGEEVLLAQRRAMLMHAEKLIQAMDEAGQELAGGSAGRGVAESLRLANRSLERIATKAEGRLDPVLAALERAQSEVSDAIDGLARLAADADLDPRHLEEVEERLFALRALARKHDTTVDALAGLAEDFAARLAAIDCADTNIAALGQAEAQAERRYLAAAATLHQGRITAAADLDRAVADELEPLRLGRARFITRIADLPAEEWGATGQDRVGFEVATNPGTPAGPLSKIASGGELARFMLALKVVLAQSDPVPTLIFDEVDAGVGGAVAHAVGERLARLATDVQVLVVTHSPQVAARGQHHWQIQKAVSDGATRVSVAPLDGGGRREEIARMLAGAAVTDEARAAADSLLQGTAA